MPLTCGQSSTTSQSSRHSACLPHPRECSPLPLALVSTAEQATTIFVSSEEGTAALGCVLQPQRGGARGCRGHHCYYVGVVMGMLSGYVCRPSQFCMVGTHHGVRFGLKTPNPTFPNPDPQRRTQSHLAHAPSPAPALLPSCPLHPQPRLSRDELALTLHAIMNQYDDENFDLGIKQFMIEQAIQRVGGGRGVGGGGVHGVEIWAGVRCSVGWSVGGGVEG